VNEFKEFYAKEREEKYPNEPKIHLLSWVSGLKEHNFFDITKFNQLWFAIVIKAIGEKFHNNFKVGFWAHSLSYRGFGLKITYEQQKIVRQLKMTRMQLVGMF
jgi:hypothetical protein